MKLSDYLTPSLVKVGLESEEKDELFEEMVHLFVEDGKLTDRADAVHALMEREAKMSTGIGKGIGLPHGKIAEAKGLLMAMGISRKGIEYDALDGEPVHVVLTVFAEIGNPGPHIEALAEVSRLFSIPGFTEKLSGAKSPSEVLSLIKQEE